MQAVPVRLQLPNNWIEKTIICRAGFEGYIRVNIPVYWVYFLGNIPEIARFAPKYTPQGQPYPHPFTIDLRYPHCSFLSTAMQESMTGIRVVKAFAREHHELEKFDKELPSAGPSEPSRHG